MGTKTSDAEEMVREERPLPMQEQQGDVTSSEDISTEVDPWETLDEDFNAADDFGGDLWEESGDSPETPGAEGKAGVPTEGTPAEVPQVPVVEEALPVEEGKVQQKPAEETPVQSQVVETPSSQEPTREELLAKRKHLEEELAKTYEISPEDADTLRLSPEEVLPKLAARVTVDTYERVLETLVSQLPFLVNNIVESRTHQRSAEEEFYAANPSLAEYAKTNGRAQVDHLAAQIAVMLRAQNPSMPKEELLRKVGQSAEAMLGLQSRAPQEAASLPKGVEETVVEEVVNRPFVPARGVSTVQQQRKAGPDNPFESLNDMWDHDEFGDG